MQKLVLIVVGSIATLLALAGVMLPGLPTTPFLLIALWAFARASGWMLGWLESIPLLREALVEARRFEERRTIRREVKVLALTMAWGSVLLTALATGLSHPIALGSVITAALGGTFAMWWCPTET